MVWMNVPKGLRIESLVFSPRPWLLGVVVVVVVYVAELPRGGANRGSQNIVLCSGRGLCGSPLPGS